MQEHAENAKLCEKCKIIRCRTLPLPTKRGGCFKPQLTSFITLWPT